MKGHCMVKKLVIGALFDTTFNEFKKHWVTLAFSSLCISILQIGFVTLEKSIFSPGVDGLSGTRMVVGGLAFLIGIVPSFIFMRVCWKLVHRRKVSFGLIVENPIEYLRVLMLCGLTTCLVIFTAIIMLIVTRVFSLLNVPQFFTAIFLAGVALAFLWLMSRGGFAVWALVEGERDAFQAFKHSYRVTEGNLLRIIGFSLLLTISIMFLAVLLMILPVCCGAFLSKDLLTVLLTAAGIIILILAYSLAWIGLTCLYKQLTENYEKNHFASLEHELK